MNKTLRTYLQHGRSGLILAIYLPTGLFIVLLTYILMACFLIALAPFVGIWRLYLRLPKKYRRSLSSLCLNSALILRRAVY